MAQDHGGQPQDEAQRVPQDPRAPRAVLLVPRPREQYCVVPPAGVREQQGRTSMSGQTARPSQGSRRRAGDAGGGAGGARSSLDPVESEHDAVDVDSSSVDGVAVSLCCRPGLGRRLRFL